MDADQEGTRLGGPRPPRDQKSQAPQRSPVLDGRQPVVVTQGATSRGQANKKKHEARVRDDRRDMWHYSLLWAVLIGLAESWGSCHRLLALSPPGQARQSCVTRVYAFLPTRKKKTVEEQPLWHPRRGLQKTNTHERLQRNPVRGSSRVSTQNTQRKRRRRAMPNTARCRLTAADIRHGEDRVDVYSEMGEALMSGHAAGGMRRENGRYSAALLACSCKNGCGNQPAVPARSSGVVYQPGEGRVVDGVPNGEDHVAHVEVAVANLQRVAQGADWRCAGARRQQRDTDEAKRRGPCAKTPPGVGVGLFRWKGATGKLGSNAASFGGIARRRVRA